MRSRATAGRNRPDRACALQQETRGGWQFVGFLKQGQCQQQAQLVLLQGDATGANQDDLAVLDLPALACLAALGWRRRAKPVDVNEVVDDADLVGRQACKFHQLAPDPLGVRQDLVGAHRQPALGGQVKGRHRAVAHRRHDDRNAGTPRRQSAPEVRLVPVRLQDRRLLLAQDLDQAPEPDPVHLAHAEHVLRLSRRQVLGVVDGVVEQADDGLEARRQARRQLQDLSFGASLLQVGDQEQHLVPRGHAGRLSTTDARVRRGSSARQLCGGPKRRRERAG